MIEKGLIGYYNGVRIFVPASQVDIRFSNNRSNLVGTELEVRLIDFSMENPIKAVASRRVILEEAKNCLALYQDVNNHTRDILQRYYLIVIRFLK